MPNQEAKCVDKEELLSRRTQLDEIDQKLSSLIRDRDELRVAMRAMEAWSNTTRGERESIRNLLFKYREQKEALVAARNKISMSLEERTRKLKSVRERMNQKWASEGQNERRRKELELKQSTETMSLQDEKSLVREIESVNAAQASVNVEEHRKLENERDEFKAQLSALRIQLEEVHGKVKEQYERQLQLGQDMNNEKQNEFEELRTKRLAFDDKINTLLQEKRQILVNWRNESEKYFADKKQTLQEEQGLPNGKSCEREIASEIWETEEANKKPWLEEIALCDFLTNYLITVQNSHAEPERPEDDNSLNCSPENAEAASNTESYTASNTSFAHFKDIISSFEVLGLSAPKTVVDIASKINELHKKREYYESLQLESTIEKARNNSSTKEANPVQPV